VTLKPAFTQITRVKLEEKSRVIVLNFFGKIHRYEFLMRVAVTCLNIVCKLTL